MDKPIVVYFRSSAKTEYRYVIPIPVNLTEDRWGEIGILETKTKDGLGVEVWIPTHAPTLSLVALSLAVSQIARGDVVVDLAIPVG